MKKKLRRYIGDRHFYKMLLAIVVPIIIQNGITNFVSLLDNLMVDASEQSKCQVLQSSIS